MRPRNPDGRQTGDATPDGAACYRVRDFLSGKDASLRGRAADLAPEDVLFEGQFLHQELRSGLVLHCSDAIERRPFTATSQIREGLSCIFLLQGAVDVSFGDRRFGFGKGQTGAGEGTAVMTARPDQFVRDTPEAQHLRHLVVSASPEWLEADGFSGLSDHGGLSRLAGDHLSSHRWTISPRLAGLIQQIIAPTPYAPALQRLYLEGRAVEIVVETLAAWMGREPATPAGALLSSQDGARLNRARDFIMANLTRSLTVEEVARAAGFNPSGLQRLFHAKHGATIFEYIREQRLERARAALCAGACSVAGAARIAGYASATNFTTAFRRRYGEPPGALLGRRSGQE